VEEEEARRMVAGDGPKRPKAEGGAAETERRDDFMCAYLARRATCAAAGASPLGAPRSSAGAPGSGLFYIPLALPPPFSFSSSSSSLASLLALGLLALSSLVWPSVFGRKLFALRSSSCCVRVSCVRRVGVGVPGVALTFDRAL
jgi:hypothetical protein